jgi:antitoxin component of MazEF toxin-antitoxin module
MTDNNNNVIKSRMVGGSMTITLPQSIVKAANIKPGDHFGYNYQDNKIIFSPAHISF